MNLPASLIAVIRNMYVKNKGVVCVDGQVNQEFDTNKGVK